MQHCAAGKTGQPIYLVMTNLKTLIAALAIGFGTAASAQNTGPVKIGFITDMSSLYVSKVSGEQAFTTVAESKYSVFSK